MKSLFAGIILVAGTFGALSMSSAAYAETKSEKKCYNFVQGNITWDKKNRNSRWNPKNVKALCKGVKPTRHIQPGLCYSMVQGNVPWNRQGAKHWNWKNVVRLCKGTNSAQYRVGCFKRKMPKMGWSKAITSCTTPKPRTTRAEKKCYNFVQGNIAWDTKNTNTRWNPKNVKTLCKNAKPGKHAEPGLCYAKTQGVVAWNKQGNKRWNWKNVVSLCKGSANSHSTVSCFKRKMRKHGWSKAIKMCN